MKDKALAVISRYGMLKAGDKIVAGVSGGADSVALIHFLRFIQKDFRLEIIAAHLNHNLRGPESDRDEDFVRDLCLKLGIPLFTKSLDISSLSKETGESVEECARNNRYIFFKSIIPEGGKIATAHTLADSVETQMLNLIRGTGIKGLCGIPPTRANIIRPLITCERGEIEAYCAENNLEFVVDSTNLSNDYTRNKLRNRVIPIILEMNPAYFRCAGRSIELLRKDEEYLARLAMEWIEEQGTDMGFPANEYLKAPEAISGRILMEICAEHGVNRDFARIELLDDMIRTGKGTMQLSSDAFFICSSGMFRVERASRVTRSSLHSVPVNTRVDIDSLPENGIIALNNGKLIKLSIMNAADLETLHKYVEIHLKNILDCDRIERILTIRTRLPGDKIRLAKRGCAKSVKKLFSENRIDLSGRNEILMISGADGNLLWLQGFGPCESCGATDNTKKILMIDVMEDINARGY